MITRDEGERHGKLDGSWMARSGICRGLNECVMDEEMNRQKDGRENRYLDDGWMDKQMGGGMDAWMIDR